MKDSIDNKRREFLLKATSIVGALGATAVALPFIKACQPSLLPPFSSEPLKVDISGLAVGNLLTVEWQNLPVWILRRTPEDIKCLSANTAYLRDPYSKVDQQPAYATNVYRSIKPDILVLIGLCTHLGCIPNLYAEPKSVSDSWQGGFLCPCHGSTFDMAGRVFKNVPAPVNLKVPEYSFLDDNTLLIGVPHAG